LNAIFTIEYTKTLAGENHSVMTFTKELDKLQVGEGVVRIWCMIIRNLDGEMRKKR